MEIMSDLNLPLDITPNDSVVPVYLVPLTEQEIVQYEQIAIEIESRTQEELDRATVRESAIEKLAQLGLTIEEAKAVIGIG